MQQHIRLYLQFRHSGYRRVASTGIFVRFISRNSHLNHADTLKLVKCQHITESFWCTCLNCITSHAGHTVKTAYRYLRSIPIGNIRYRAKPTRYVDKFGAIHLSPLLKNFRELSRERICWNEEGQWLSVDIAIIQWWVVCLLWLQFHEISLQDLALNREYTYIGNIEHVHLPNGEVIRIRKLYPRVVASIRMYRCELKGLLDISLDNTTLMETRQFWSDGSKVDASPRTDTCIRIGASKHHNYVDDRDEMFLQTPMTIAMTWNSETYSVSCAVMHDFSITCNDLWTFYWVNPNTKQRHCFKMDRCVRLIRKCWTYNVEMQQQDICVAVMRDIQRKPCTCIARPVLQHIKIFRCCSSEPLIHPSPRKLIHSDSCVSLPYSVPTTQHSRYRVKINDTKVMNVMNMMTLLLRASLLSQMHHITQQGFQKGWGRS